MYKQYLLSDVCIGSNQKDNSSLQPLQVFIITDLSTSKIVAIDCIMDESVPIGEVVQALYKSSTVEFPHELRIDNAGRDDSLLQLLDTYPVEICTSVDSKFYREYRVLLEKHFSERTANTICTISEVLKSVADEYNDRQEIPAV